MIDQDYIYSISRCPKYTNHFNSIFPYPTKYNIFNTVLKKIFNTHLKTGTYQNIEPISYKLMLELYNDLKSDQRFLPQQIKKSINDHTLILSKILNIINIASKVPVFGPTFHYYSHDTINLKLTNLCLYRSLSGEYYAYYLSPYTNSFQAKNDPIPHLLWKLVDEFIYSSLNKSVSLILKIIYIKNNGEVDHDDIFSCNKQPIEAINNILKNKHFSAPQFNCKEKCKYRKKCTL